jgi:spore maturation protein CgeB
MNRDLILEVKKETPDIIFFFAKSKILFGTSVCIKTMYSKIKIIWVWPNTPLNLERFNIDNTPFIDLLCTYSSSTKDVFKKMGYKNVLFLPLGADIDKFHISVPCDEYIVDIGFVGGWRPEREYIFKVINDNFPSLVIEIHGPNWRKMTKDVNLRKRILSDGIYENDLAQFFNKTRINMNIIDDTNFPAANMRFFEIPISNSLQLSSSCPEMETIFIDNQDVIYFNSQNDIINKINFIIDNPQKAEMIRKNGYKKVLNNHTYDHRVEKIFSID